MRWQREGKELSLLRRFRMKTLYFCFGDNRAEERQYRIFKIRDMADVYELANALGYDFVLDNCPKFNKSPDLTKRMVRSSLEAIEIVLQEFENVVSCWRTDYDEAQRLKRHFLSSDMSLYFPKFLSEPIPVLHNGQIYLKARRDYPWILEYWSRNRFDPNDFRIMDGDAMEELKQAVRKK